MCCYVLMCLVYGVVMCCYVLCGVVWCCVQGVTYNLAVGGDQLDEAPYIEDVVIKDRDRCVECEQQERVVVPVALRRAVVSDQGNGGACESVELCARAVRVKWYA